MAGSSGSTTCALNPRKVLTRICTVCHGHALSALPMVCDANAGLRTRPRCSIPPTPGQTPREPRMWSYAEFSSHLFKGRIVETRALNLRKGVDTHRGSLSRACVVCAAHLLRRKCLIAHASASLQVRAELFNSSDAWARIPEATLSQRPAWRHKIGSF